jgi:hypothetical protein
VYIPCIKEISIMMMVIVMMMIIIINKPIVLHLFETVQYNLHLSESLFLEANSAKHSLSDKLIIAKVV